jgi:uncharacterized protein (DUF4415 family)
MSMKKTDLEKQRAKQLDGRLKSSLPPQRFGKASAAAAARPDARPSPATPKLVPLSIRLPADVVQRLRERAVGHDGGLSALMTEAAEHWLAAAGGADAR